MMVRNIWGQDQKTAPMKNFIGLLKFILCRFILLFYCLFFYYSVKNDLILLNFEWP